MIMMTDATGRSWEVGYGFFQRGIRYPLDDLIRVATGYNTNSGYRHRMMGFFTADVLERVNNAPYEILDEGDDH